MSKFKPKYKWRRRAHHLAVLNAIKSHRKEWAAAIGFSSGIHWSKAEEAELSGIKNYIGIKTPLGELSIIANSGGRSTPD